MKIGLPPCRLILILSDDRLVIAISGGLFGELLIHKGNRVFLLSVRRIAIIGDIQIQYFMVETLQLSVIGLSVTPIIKES